MENERGISKHIHFFGSDNINTLLSWAFENNITANSELILDWETKSFITELYYSQQFLTIDAIARKEHAPEEEVRGWIHEVLSFYKTKYKIILDKDLEVDAIEKIIPDIALYNKSELSSIGKHVKSQTEHPIKEGDHEKLVNAGRKGGKDLKRVRFITNTEQPIPEYEELCDKLIATDEVKELLATCYETGAIFELPNDPADHAIFIDSRNIVFEYYTTEQTKVDLGNKYGVNSGIIGERLRRAIDFWAEKVGMERIVHIAKPGQKGPIPKKHS